MRDPVREALAGLLAFVEERARGASVVIADERIAAARAALAQEPTPDPHFESVVLLHNEKTVKTPADDLVLRQFIASDVARCDPHQIWTPHREAAAAIEALQAEVAELRRQAIGNCQHWKDAYDRMALRMQEQEVRAAAAEIKAEAYRSQLAILMELDAAIDAARGKP